MPTPLSSARERALLHAKQVVVELNERIQDLARDIGSGPVTDAVHAKTLQLLVDALASTFGVGYACGEADALMGPRRRG